MNRRWPLHYLLYLFVTGLVGCIVLIYYKLTNVNPTTAALTFLLGILFVANRLGLRYAVYMSLLAAFCLNFFFLPPIGTLTISDSQNWVALLAFLIAGVSGSHLSNRVKKEAQEANRRRREVERLYEFSQKLMTPDRAANLLNHVPSYVSSTFHNASVAIYLLDHEDVYRSLAGLRKFTKEELYKVAIRAEPSFHPAEESCIIPLFLGLRSMGAIGISGNLPSRETIDALGSLVAIAIERSMTAERLARSEAQQENERLRTALLDSVTHELRTPLTAIKASITSLKSGMVQNSEMKEEMLTVIDEESDRLNRLIGQAVEMAQLDAQRVQLQLEPEQMKKLVEDAVTEWQAALEGHAIEMRIPDNLPAARLDASWIRKVLQHLLENAAKYSEKGKPIVVSVEARGSFLVTSIADQGEGIDDFDKALIFDKFYRGQSQRYRVQGTGMGLAIVKAIIEAHGGAVEVVSQRKIGSVFSFSLPLA